MNSITRINPSCVPIIACATDEHYAAPLSVMLISMAQNLGRYSNSIVYIMNAGLSEQTKIRIQQSVKTDKLEIHWVDLPSLKKLELPIFGHISEATYYRLFIAEILPFEKIIYLDADMLILDDIGILWDLDLNGAWLRAVRQISPKSCFAGSERGLPSYKDLCIPPDTLLFNAGVMLIDLAKWRTNGVASSAVNFLNKFANKVLWWDQDALNALLWDKWTPLPFRWNTMLSLFKYFNTWEDSPLSKAEYMQSVSNPAIFHYNSKLKPWHDAYRFPFRKEYFDFLKGTPWE